MIVGRDCVISKIQDNTRMTKVITKHLQRKRERTNSVSLLVNLQVFKYFRSKLEPV